MADVSANDKIGIAIQGAGNVSGGHLRAYLHNPYCEVVAISSRTKEGAARRAQAAGLDPGKLALYDDVDDLMADPTVDALSICTPHGRHAQDAIAAAQAGKHMIVEKPIATNVADLLAMDAAITAAGVHSVCGFVLRWIPSVLALLSLRDEGMFGDLLFVQTDYWHNPEQSGYPGSEDYLRRKADASAMQLGGCHAVDLARYLMGSDIVSVAATSFSNIDDLPYPPNQAAVVQFANGKGGRVSAMQEQWIPYQFNVDLLGDGGGFRHNRFYSRKIDGALDWITIPTITPDSGAVDHHPFQGEIDHFIDCLRENRESHANVRDSVNTHLAVFAIDQSCAEGGRQVHLSELTA
ncbi:MAG: Gfo/Idh/MocA family oxidoreductase [Thermomicrobiales bacterium]|nr:Gfo/Idh/MocA family oxidoreductase [Thermomicrobiales bacterium]